VIDTIDVLIDEKGGIQIGIFSEYLLCSFKTRVCFTRLRSSIGQERLGVSIYEDNEDEPYAATFISNSGIEQDIHNLCDYGVFLSRKDIAQIAKHIKTEYRNMEVVADEAARTLETDFPDILRHICAYVWNSGIEIRTIGNFDIYCIDVIDFRKLFKGSAYAMYGHTAIRRILRDTECTVCNSNRYDYTIKDGESNTPYKVIALNSEAPEVYEIMQAISYDIFGEELREELINILDEDSAAV
jgi:hypothetical protein